MKTVQDMTLEDLTQFVEQTVDRKLAHIRLIAPKQPAMTWKEAADMMRRVRRILPPGAKSSLELLREDRNN